MKLQTATRLGLYAVLELAREPGRTLSATDLAERFGVSSHHLAKVLRTLSTAGLVRVKWLGLFCAALIAASVVIASNKAATRIVVLTFLFLLSEISGGHTTPPPSD